MNAAPLRRAGLAIALVSLCLLGFSTNGTAQLSPFKHPDGTTHWYQAVDVVGGITWSQANFAANKAGGYLATITSKLENEFVSELALQNSALWSNLSGPWLGGIQASGAKEPAAGWAWAEIEPFTYAPWASKQPDNKANDDRLCMVLETSADETAVWADEHSSEKLLGYVVEYSGPTAPATVGVLFRKAGSQDGYTLLNVLFQKQVHLVDFRGRLVNSWSSNYLPGAASYLTPKGTVLRCGRIGNPDFPVGGRGGIIEEFDWAGKRIWSYTHSSKTYLTHHDLELLPNGNILMIAWEKKTKAEAIAAGRDPDFLTNNEVWPDKIIEIKPNSTGGDIVWEWHAWDHLVQEHDPKKANYGDPSKKPELIDLNFSLDGRDDWLHCNGIGYDPTFDLITISVPHFNEVWVIDHSTTTKEAAGHTGGKRKKGGDLLFRWGNPQAYGGGTSADQKLFFQHNSQFIAKGLPGAGNILIFNNGTRRTPTPFSQVIEVALPLNSLGNFTGTAATWAKLKPAWVYQDPEDVENFYSRAISGVQRLPNGNTLVCNGIPGQVFEVDSNGNKVWEYVGGTHQGEPAPNGNSLFRAPRYFADYPGLKGRDLTPTDTIELPQGTVLLADGSPTPHRAPVGTDLKFSVRAADFPGRTYYVLTAASPGLIPLDFRYLRSGWDALLMASYLGSAPTIFKNCWGTLDAKGQAKATLSIPDNPAIAGMRLYTTFVVLDPMSRSVLGVISNTVTTELTK